MSNTLVEPNALADFPGAPFPAALVDAAVGYIRRVAGWHIAPSETETVTVDASGGVYLFLPSLLVTNVTEVRDLSGETPQVVSGWRSIGRGMLRRDAGWPCGEQIVEADIVHGYDTCPPELLPAIAERAQRSAVDSTVSSTKIDDFAESYRDVAGSAAVQGSAVDLFTVPRRTA